MNRLSFLVIFALVSSMMFSSLSSTVLAQEDLSILLDITLKAQNQIQKQISNTNASGDILALFEEGKKETSLLESSIKDNDISSAKKHFLAAMNIFKKISSLLEQTKPKPQTKTTITISINDPTSELYRLYSYIQNLKLASKNYQLNIDFSKVDSLVSDAKEKISNEQFDDAKDTMNDIKQEITLIVKTLNDYVQDQNTQRAKAYAQSYLEQLDRLISAAKSQGISQEIITKLEDARNNLASASSSKEIIYQIKEIILLKKQFELTKVDRLESKLIQTQKIIDRLSNTNGISQSDIDKLQKQLEDVKDAISSGDFEGANNILKSIAEQITLLKKSTST